jgi:hypothetical protein
MPVVEGDWWRIAGDDPDVSPFRIVDDGNSNTCDFTIYQDAKGMWHAIACVRGTNAPGERVFHHWTSDSLTAEAWQPQGVLDWPRGNRFGKPTSVQAPHALRYEGKYYCFYNSGSDGARAMVSDDGARWSVFTNTAGEESIFSMGRDVNLFHDVERDRWQATYTGEWPGGEGHAMVCRTAPSLAGPWCDPPSAVRTEGNPESPFIIRRGRHYYLFQQMEVFISDRPTQFAGETLTHMTGIWYGGKWAPEVISHNGEDYLAGYGRGLWVAKLKWVEMTSSQAKAHAGPILEKVRAGRAAAEERRRERERRKKSADGKAKVERNLIHRFVRSFFVEIHWRSWFRGLSSGDPDAVDG